MTEFDVTTAQPGSELPSVLHRPSTMQLFMFSAVTWNRHRIHYEKDFAISDGLQNVAVHRSLLGAFISQLLSDWAGDAGRVVRMQFSVRGSAAIDRPLQCSGRVTARYQQGERELIDCEVWIDDDAGRRIVPGTATIELQAATV